MKIAAAGVVSVIIAGAAMPAFANDWKYVGMSGLATNALVRAYEASRLDNGESPPLRLEKYVVTIRSNGSSFIVFFLAQTEAVAMPVVVSARTGAIIWKEGEHMAVTMPDLNLTAGYLLPGIIAGEIIAAYRQAASDQFKPLSTGAYNIWYDPRAGASVVGFTKLDGPPSVVSTEPAATPTPNAHQSCSSVGLTGPNYTVTVINSEVSVHRDHPRVPGCD